MPDTLKPKTGTLREAVDFLNENQVAQRLGVSIATVRRWRSLNIGPRFRKIGVSVRYPTDDLNTWIEAQPSGGGLKRT